MLSAYPAYAQQIVTDGRTATTLATQGNTTNVFTATQRGANAFNSFIRFDVNAGNIANLHVPTSATNLINLVSGSATNIHGVLNAVKDGRIGGNVWFANPYGFIVGATGIVNVGSLNVSTPTPQFVDGFFLFPGNPNDAAVAQLLSGTAPRSGTGLISIQGQVNAIDGVTLSAGAINVGGSIYSGARFVGTAPNFSDVVNANGLAAATHVVERDGRIQIVADRDVAVSGTIAAPGAPGVKGGDISIRAGGNIELNPGANVVARGLGEGSRGGTIYVYGANDATFSKGAVIDARAGTSGDGGSIELSAARNVNLAGGEFKASAQSGRNGSVLIDPVGIFITTVAGSDAFRITDGADLTLSAIDSITVDPGVIVSTRNVANPATDNHETAASAGNSGNLTFSAPTITIGTGGKILTFADGAFNAGNVNLDATVLGVPVGTVTLGQNAQIRASSGTGAGGSVTLNAATITTGPGALIQSGSNLSFTAIDAITVGANNVFSTARGGGASGNLSLTAPEITVGDGAEISTAATGARNAGTLTLDASGNEIFGQTLTIGQNAKLLATAVDGDAGAITLTAGSISTGNGSQIHAHATGAGNAADVTIEAKRTPAINIMGYREGSSSVVLNGTNVHGENINISATTTINNEWTNDGQQPVDGAITIVTNIAQVAASTLAAYLGLDLVHSQVIGTATVTIGAGTSLIANNDVTVTATNNTSAGVIEAPPLPGSAALPSPLGLGAMYMRNQSNAIVEFKTGSSVTAKNLTVRAHNEAELEGSVEASADARFGVSLGAGVTYADINAKAKFESGVTVNVTDQVDVIATNVNKFSNESSAMTGQDAGGQGVAAVIVAYSDHKSKSEVEVGSNITGAKRVRLLSIDEVKQDTTVAESKVGQTLTDAVVNGLDRKALGVTEAGQDTLLGLFFGGTLMSEKVKPKSTPFRFGGAIAIANSEATATAKVADGVTIGASEYVVTGSRVVAEDTGTQAHAAAVSNDGKSQSTTDTSKVSVSAGVVVANYKNTSEATVGVGSTITAPKIGVAADISLPAKQLDEILRFDSWDNLKANVETIVSAIDPFTYFNGGASAKSSATNIGLSGSVNIQTYENNARAIIDRNAKLLISGTGTGAWDTTFQVKPADPTATPPEPADDQTFSFDAAAHVRADHEAHMRWLAGKPTLAASGPKAIGGAYNQVTLKGDTFALVREGAEIRSSTGATAAADEAHVTAKSTEDLLTVAAVAGSGESFGLAGTFSITTINRNTIASIDNEAAVRAKSVKINAVEEAVSWSVGGGLSVAQGSSVGIGIGVNEATIASSATIADNDTLAGRSSVLSATGVVAAKDLQVLANTSGHLETIAIAGAVASNSDNPNGFFSGLKDKYDQVMLTVAKVVDAKPRNSSKGAKGSKGTGQKYSFTFAGAGSAAVNLTSVQATSLIENAVIQQFKDAPSDTPSLVVRAINDTDIVAASGAGALTRAGQAGGGTAVGIAGAVAVNLLSGGSEAAIRNSSVTGTDQVSVQAVKAGENLSLGIGLNVNASASTKTSWQGTGSVSVTLSDTASTTDDTGATKNQVLSTIDNSTVTGQAGDVNRSVDVLAYNRTQVGTGAGSLAINGKNSIGGAVTYSDVRHDTEASIKNSSLTQLDTVGVSTFNSMQIAAAAAMGTATAQANATTISAAVVINDITNNSRALLQDSTVTTTGNVSVRAFDVDKAASMDALLAPTPAGVTRGDGYDYSGSEARTVAGTPAGAGGNSIVAVAGNVSVALGAGSKSAGVAVNYNRIQNTLDSAVTGSNITTTTGDLNIQSDSKANILGIAAGVSVSSDLAGAGSVTVNEIDNSVTARLSSTTALKTSSAANINVTASDNSRLDTLAGAVSVSLNGNAGGAAVTYNAIDNVVAARLEGGASTLLAANATDTITVSSLNDSRLRSLAVAGAVAAGGSGVGFAGSIGLNFITNKTESTIDKAVLDDPAGGANTNTVSVKAEDKSEIQTLAGSVAVGISSAAGGAFTFNKITNTNLASIEDSTLSRVGQLDVTALETSQITAFSVAGGGGNNIAIFGSVSLNYIGEFGDGTPDEDGNVTIAEVKNSSVTGSATADANIKAEDTSTIRSLAGAVSVSIGATAVGAGVADNATRNVAKASVFGSTITNFDTLLVQGKNNSLIESLSAAGSGGSTAAFAGSASSNRTQNRTFGEISGSDMIGGTAAVNVNSLDTAAINSLAGSVAIGISAAGIGASVAVNRIANTTEARITGKKTAAGLDVLDLGVKADSTATIQTLAVAGGGGGAVGVAGSASINIIDSVTEAHISGSAVVESDRNAAVIAESDDRITVAAGAVGVGISAAGVGASAVVNQIGGATKAHISGPGTVVSARNLGGTPTLTVASGALNAAVNLLGGTDTATYVRPDLVALRATESTSGVAVNASATHHVESYVVNAGVGGVAGISGVANVNIIGGETSAYIDSATINRNDSSQNNTAGANQRVHVKASDHAYGNMFIGSVGAGGIVGVGITADVAVFDRDTKAYVDSSNVTAKGSAAIAAQSSQGMSTVVVGGAGGLVGVVGAGSVVKYTSDTEARLSGSTATVGSLDVKAKHDTDMFIVGGAIAVGAVGVGATFDVALDNSVTKAHIDGSTVTTSGQVNVDAQSSSEVHTWTIAGSAAGTVAVAGTASVILIGNTTQAWVSGSSIGTSGARAGGLSITAKDVVTVEQNAGAGAGAGVAGVGVAAAITKMENTTSAYMNNSAAYVANDVVVDAQAERDMGTIVATAGGGVFAGVGGSVGVTLVGAALQNDQNGETNANKELNKDGGGTLNDVNSFSNGDVIGSDNLSNSSDNGYAGAGLSSSEITAINNKARLNTNNQVYNAAAQSAVAETFDPATQLTGKTAAIIGGASVVNANRDVKVSASEKDRIRMFTGAIAGGLAGVGGSVSITEITNNVEAAILGTTVTTANADLSGTGIVEVTAATGKLFPGDKALESKAYQAAGGAVALGAAVAVGNITNNVKATIGRGTQTTVASGTGNITVKATDTQDIDTEALGLQVGLVAAGGVVDRATKSGSVIARFGNTNAPTTGAADTFADLGSGTLTVQAERSGSVTAHSLAGAGGIVAGTGSSAYASDTGSVQALVGNLTDVDSTGGAVNINATATPQAKADSFGVNAGLLAVGASIAEATSTATVNATLGAGADVTGANVTVSANRAVPGGGGRTAWADSSGSAGGLVGVSATSATATSGGTVSSIVGDGATLTLTGAASITATNDSSQFADVSGIAAGIVAAGSNVATATSNTTTTADVGDLVKATGTSFTVNATGTDTNIAKATSGSGGVVSGAAATANTGALSLTTATTGSGDLVRQLAADGLIVSAKHTTNFNGEVDSVNASLVGGSGAYANNTVNSTVTAMIGDSGRVTAKSVVVKAENISKKDWLGGAANGDDAGWNILSGSGGVVDLPAGKSESHVTHNTTAGIGNSADVHVVMPAVGNGVFALDAYNEITGRDKAKLDSGGLVAVAKASALFYVDNANATVSFGTGAKVTSDLGDINAGARSLVDLDTRASADAYGLAGAPEGNAYSIYTGNNQALINAGAVLTADDGAIFISGGQSSNGTVTNITAKSTVNLWNKTAFPVSTDPDAQSNVVSNAAVRIFGPSTGLTATTVQAAGDISLLADKGSLNLTASGIGKDIYRETAGAIASGISNLFGGDDVSFDITGGSTSSGGLAQLQVDGKVLTGIHRTESLTLDYQLLTAPGCSTPPCVVNGRVAWQLVPTATQGVNYTLDLAVGLAANIQKRIDKLRSLMAQYVGDSIAVASYQSEINFLMFKLVELGLASGTGPGGSVLVDANTGQPIINPGQWNNPSPLQAAQTQITQYQAQVSGATTSVNLAGTTVRDTASSAYTSAGTITSNAGTIDTNYGTVATSNGTIQTGLQNLAGFSAANATYTQTTTLISNNSTLRTEINTRASSNNTDRATVDTRRSEINTLLTEIAGTTNQTTIDTKQAQIQTKTGEINTLLGTISTRNSEIKSRADQIVSNNATVAANQAALANAWKNGDGSEAGEVTAITNSINGTGTARSNISTAAGTITTQTGLFTGGSGYVTTVATSKTEIDTAITSKTSAQTQITTLTAALPTLSNVAANGPIADFVIVDDISVKLGNIRTKADVLTGTGALLAPGDAQITITNNTPNFLKVNDLTVLSDDGGTIRYNGVLVNNNADINRLNPTGTGAALSQVVSRDTQGVAVPQVTINSNYDPNGAAYTNFPAPAPDIELNGNITNLRGSVTVRSKAGSIYSNGSISAGTVDVKADNGDFVQSFVDNFFHVGGDPASIQAGSTTLGGGIIANGAVFISARFLNINSLVQSGIEQWNLTLPSSPILTGPATLYGVSQSQMDANVATYKNGGARFHFFVTPAGTVTHDALLNRLEVSKAYADADKNTGDWATRTAGFAGLYPLVADYGNIGSSYDPANPRYVLDGTQVRGGYIQLFGQVMNTSATTGAGKLKVLDGYGQINVQNPTGLPVVINNLDTGADPTGTGRGVAGKIDIMDVQSVNTSNGTSGVIHSVYTRDYDPVTGASSVKLKKEVGTLNGDGSLTVSSTPVNGADATATDNRHTSYTPQSDLRYVWTTGTDNSTVTYWEYAGAQFFGSADLRTAPTGTVVSKSGPHILNSFRLSDGTYLSKGVTLGGTHVSGDYQATSTTSSSGNSLWVKTGEWSNCNWWTLCIAQDYHMTFTETKPTKTITTNSKKGDYPIAIEFSGVNQGAVTVNSTSDVLLQGAVRNRAGDTTITSAAGIVQVNDSALISSKNLTLTAGTSVGKPLGVNPVIPVQVDVAGGALNASAAAGNVLVNQTLGDLKVGSITAAGNALTNNGRVILTADGSILANNPATSVIQGNLVDLTSENGTIGSIASPLVVNAGYTDTATQRGFYGLKAAAQGDIGIETKAWAGNTSGNLLVNTVVSAGGDVKLVAPGRIIDNNPNEQIDNRTWNELLDFWNSLALLAGPENDAKKAAAINAYEDGKTQDYRLYWLIRERQADPSVYNPAFVYAAKPAEIAALTAAGMTGAQIAQFEANRTTQYHQLHIQVGGFTPAFSSTFHYEVAPGSPEEIALLKGSTWTERELGISISPGMLKNITNTNPVVKSANVQGRNVTLQAGIAMGESQNQVTVPYNVDPSCNVGPGCLTDDMKVALAAAERNDIVDTGTGIDVLRRKPLNFEAPLGLSATIPGGATGHADAGKAFLASLGNGILDTISVPGEARIKVRGSIVNETTGTSAIQAGSLVLEAANGGIGYIPADGVNPAVSRPLRIDLANGGTLIARAADNVDIIETAGDMSVDTVFSRKNATLTAAGSILDAHAPFTNAPTNTIRESDMNVLAENVTLTAQTGSIGTATNSLDVGVNPDGRIAATASTFGQGVYLNGPFISSFNIGSITSGDAMHFSSDVNMLIDGPVNGPGPIQIIAGGDVNMSQNAHVRATNLGLFLDASSLTMVSGAFLQIDVGTIDIRTDGDARITGIYTGNPTESAIVITAGGSIFDNGDNRIDIIADTPAPPGSGFAGAKLTMTAGGQIGGNPLELQLLNLDAVTAGLVHINTSGSVIVGTLVAGSEVLLNSTGSITGNSITSASQVSLASAGAINLASVTGQTTVALAGQTGVTAGALTSATGSVTASSLAGNVNVGTTTAATSATFSAPAGALTTGTTTATTGSASLIAGGNISAGTTTAGQNVAMTSTAGSITTGTTTATGGSATFSAAGNVSTTTTTAAQNVATTSTGGSVTSGTTTATGGSVTTTASGDVTATTTTAGQNVTTTSTAGDITTGTTTATGGSVTATASGDINATTTTAGQNVTTTSTTGDITTGTTTATGGSVTATASGDINATTTTAGQNVTAASTTGTITTNSVTATGGSASLTAPGDVTVNTGTAGAGFTADSSAGNVTTTTVTANAVTLAAAGDVTGGTVNAGSNVNLAGTTVNATVNGGPLVGGSVSGYNGTVAGDVDLTLSSPGGFALTNFLTTTGSVNLPSGSFGVDNFIVMTSTTVNNPQTSLVIDQTTKSILPFDVQLYTGGGSFSLGLTGNHVTTSALVINHSPLHDVLAAGGGPALVAVTMGNDTLTLASTPPPAAPQGEQPQGGGALITYTGIPVALEGEPADCKVRPEQPGCKQ